jgi:hypothetical protein
MPGGLQPSMVHRSQSGEKLRDAVEGLGYDSGRALAHYVQGPGFHPQHHNKQTNEQTKKRCICFCVTERVVWEGGTTVSLTIGEAGF